MRLWLVWLWLHIKARLFKRPFALACLPNLTKPFIAGGRYLSRAEMKALRAVSSLGTFWIGYDKGGFDIPDDERLLLWIKSESDDAGVAVSASELTPDFLYVYVFSTLEASADANGEQMGIHPCAAVCVAIEDFKMALFVGMGEE